MSKTVLVTGATGFIASHAIQQLLEKTTYHVRGTVRSLQKPDTFAHLTALPDAASRLQLVEANLLDADVWASAVKDCDAVFHIASPYSLTVNDPQKDLVDPAERGTEHVIRAAINEATVKDIVLTSSVAAITDSPVPGKVFTEADWNTLSNLHRNPYYYSKVRGEKRAWDLLKDVPNKRLVVLNPFLVVGPSMTKSINESVATFIGAFNGELPAMANLSWGIVDVRDVALAHVLALTHPQAQGRHILMSRVLSMQEAFAVLRHKYPTANLPKWTAPNFVMRAMAYFKPAGTAQYMHTNVGKGAYALDASKSVRELGLEYRSVDESLIDTIENAIKWGHIARL